MYGFVPPNEGQDSGTRRAWVVDPGRKTIHEGPLLPSFPHSIASAGIQERARDLRLLFAGRGREREADEWIAEEVPAEATAKERSTALVGVG